MHFAELLGFQTFVLELQISAIFLGVVHTGAQSFRWRVFHLPVQTGMGRNDCVSFHFSYHVFSRSIFWNGMILF